MSSRKIKDVTVSLDNRDRGKTFRITEMPATQAERWAYRALSAASKGGADIPIEALGMGMAAIAVVGIQVLLRSSPEDALPLLDEMMGCVEIVTSAGLTRKLIEDDIEDVTTRLFLRSEVIEVHTGFSVAAGLSNLGSVAKQAAGSTSPKSKTSRPRSRR